MKISDMELPEEEQKMHRLVNLVSFEDDVTADDLKLADDAKIKVYTYQEVLEQGNNNSTF
jgi:hypothetical protein